MNAAPRQIQGNAPHAEQPAEWELCLHVAGQSVRSVAGHYDLEVIDAHQQAELARDEQIVVLPTLIKSRPGSPRRMVGDLSDEEQVLVGLGLEPEDASPNGGIDDV